MIARRVCLASSMLVAIVAVSAAQPASGAGRRGPSSLTIEPGGKLIVLCEKSGSIARLNPESGHIEGEVHTGGMPQFVTPHPDGERLYVSCTRGQEILEMASGSLQILRRFPLRGEPTGVALSADGKRLFAGVHLLDQVAVFDLETGAELKRLAAGNAPYSLQRSPGGQIYVTNILTNPVRPGKQPRLEITVVDESRARVAGRLELANANIGRGIAFTPDGKLAIAAITRPKNLVPMVQVARGWVVTNGFAVLFLEEDREPVQLLIDLPNLGYSDAHGVVVAPDNSAFYLSAAGADMVMAVDIDAVLEVCAEIEAGAIHRHADHLGLSRRYVTARIPVGANPRGLAISSDGRWVYVANRLDDTISIIDTKANKVDRTLVMGNPPAPGHLLTGEILFHSARNTFQEQFVCVSCHPEGGFDALQYDLEPDGIGMDLLDNRSLRGVVDTEPFKWVGTNPDIATQCGTRTAKWIARTGWLSSAETVALADYIHSIPAAENPHPHPDGSLTDSQLRGKRVFEREVTNDGTPIPETSQCHFCHSGPAFTNHERFDVGTRSQHDRKSEFDTAHLTNIFESSPFLHDGRAATLEEIWTRYNPEDKHGISSDWTKQQLNDLVEYLKSIGPPKEVP